MNLRERFRLWRAVRAERRHQRWLRKSRTMMRLPKPDPRCVVPNTRGRL